MTTPSTSHSVAGSDATTNAQADKDAFVRNSIAVTAENLKDALADLKRQCEALEGSSSKVYISGSITVEVRTPVSQSHQISVVDDLEADPPSLGVVVKQLDKAGAVNGNTKVPSDAPSAPSPYSHPFFAPASTNLIDLDRALESDLIPRRKRKRDDGEEEESNMNGQGSARKRLREDLDDEPMEADEKDLMDMSSKEFQTLLSELRDDVQEDTTAGLNHLQRLLRRWREQWREKNGWLFDYFKLQHEEERRKKQWFEAKFKALEDALGTGDTPIEDELAEGGEVADKAHKIMAQFRNLSNQIRWVEDCRRIADEAHDIKEDNWRITSATFHDNSQQRQQSHENWVKAELKKQGNVLTQVLTEVRGLSNLTMSLKWETPTGPAPNTASTNRAPVPIPRMAKSRAPPFPTLPDGDVQVVPRNNIARANRPSS
ncbi:hypothetical protein W97_04417 [Coniosporium apollinis CBS 100218]|uniref:Uncharacterized protein n=1 Tax=Coniosporium apollinis (strain CBS 100218) TaxID=1168221 RepID=R7YTG7_CONA1|nr:uncharacterized protein W97_04417 [Coniosporium apollinis CBS 100218]EON65180.1 hypothetical protein W97_04417 [Coniosporium apollinis CBS 100218]